MRSAILVSRPYQQRRVYATAKKLWPELDVICASARLPLDGHVATIGDAERVVNMLVGDTRRIDVYARRGFATPPPMPDDVRDVYDRLVGAGYTERLVPTP